jgi:hypothetical protein
MNASLTVLCLCAVLSGCAGFSPPLEPGLTTRDQVVARYGPPSREWRDDGTVTLEYATQPRGVSCFMLSFDAQGRLTNAFDALSDRSLARVRPGMSEAEVDRLLGRHARETYFNLSGETVWDWNVPSLGPALATLFHVHFKDGRVVRTSRTFVMGKDGDLVFHAPAYLNCPRCTPPQPAEPSGP